MTRRELPPPRLLAVLLPVCAAGLGVTVAAAAAFAVTPHKTATLLGLAALLAASTLADRFPVPVEDVDTGGVSLSFVFGVASIVLFGWAAGLIVVFLAPGLPQLPGRAPPLAPLLRPAGDPAPPRPPPADPRRLQRLRARACGDGRGRGRHATRRRGRERRPRPRGRRRRRAVRGQPDSDHGSRRRQHAPFALRARALEHPLDDRAVLADGLGRADARRALAALAVPLRCACGPAARDPALPARDRARAPGNAARAHRPADRPREPPPLPRMPRAGTAARRRAASPAHPLSRRRRR